MEDTLTKLVEEEKYVAAFEKALTMANLSVLVYLCKQVEPKVVFRGENEELPQKTILSLIQQLSVELEHETGTKVAYLHDSVAMLNREEEITRDQMSFVLQFLTGELYQTIDDKQRTDPQCDQLESLKMLLRTVRTILSRCKR